jgi:hypothetical protein
MAVRLIHLIWALPGVLVALTGAYRLRTEESSEPATSKKPPDHLGI